MSTQQIVEALAGIIGGIVTAWIAWKKVWRERILPRRIGQRARAKARQNLRFYLMTGTCEVWARRHGASRALMLVVDCLDPAIHPPHVSIIAEAVGDGVSPTFMRWQGWRADPAYLMLLSRVVASDAGVVITPKDMAEGALRDFYQVSGVTAALVFRIASIGPGLVFGSISFTGAVEQTMNRARRLQGDPVRMMVAEARAAYRCIRSSDNA